MFDTIGQDPDPEAPRRRRLSVWLATWWGASITGALLWLPIAPAPASALPSAPDEPLVELVLSGPRGVRIPAPLSHHTDAIAESPTPEPDPGTGGGTAGHAHAQPDDVSWVFEPHPLQAKTGPEPRSFSTGCCPDCGEINACLHPEPPVRPHAHGIKRRSELRYPERARTLGLGTQRCEARVSIDTRGVPYDVRVEGCPEPFHPETRSGLLRWRWHRPRRGPRGERHALIYVTYEPD